MWLLLACSPPTPGLTLPPAPTAEHAQTLAVDRLLAPTPLGAHDELLCPWVRGEAVPDATVARWLAEGRLTWRVLEVGTTATLGGAPVGDVDARIGFGAGPTAELEALADAARSLEDRCGGTLPRDTLLVAGPDVVGTRVATAWYLATRAGFEAPWVLVDDASPEPPPTASAPPGAGAGATGTAQAGEDALELVLVSSAPPKVFQDGAPFAGGVAEALAARPEGLYVTVEPASPWSATVALVDAGRGVDVGAALAMSADPPASPGAVGAPAVVQGASPAAATRTAHLHEQLAALPLTVPRPCDDGRGCGCPREDTDGGEVGLEERAPARRIAPGP